MQPLVTIPWFDLARLHKQTLAVDIFLVITVIVARVIVVLDSVRRAHLVVAATQERRRAMATNRQRGMGFRKAAGHETAAIAAAGAVTFVLVKHLSRFCPIFRLLDAVAV